ncbi:Trypsin-like peptidase domain-containing protein [Thiothrix caldifontis]|uniref:Serine protease n=1 Tax=Thiothrix caldifontis TaxID=525918 RepID=A0A1H3Z4B1_9GAMM|nr:trypsin-like peptidase domain-containing protein [Thiothrix caldifontis]SEA18629.1 Trypsin-like peptidase domain-containing protein [Thiothrix caldifontis]
MKWVQVVAALLTVMPYVTGCGEGSTAATSQTNTDNNTAAANMTVTEPSPSTPAVSSANSSTSYTLVSSSGTIISPTNNSAANNAASFGSTGTEGRLEADNVDLTPLSDAERAAIKITTPTATARIIQESILGFDSRFQVIPASYPERAVTLITYNGNTHCSGWLVSKDTLVTAGHCVHGGGSTGRWGAPTAFKVYPGFSDGYAPYGSCTPRELYSTYGWITNADSNADIGIIKLDCTVGNSTGYFSYAVTDTIDNTAVNINGYPGDKAGGGQQWGSKGIVLYATPTKIHYDNDTTGGMSGSPVWVQDSTTAWAFGIHTNGENTLAPGSNSGTRISKDVFDLITAAKALP